MTMTPLRLVCFALALSAAPAHAQQAPPSETAKNLVGTWELSNADHDRVCQVTFSLEAAGTAYTIKLGPKCADQFPALANVTAWTLGKRDALLLTTPAGETVLELTEVESGTYEGLRPNEGRYILQNAAVVAASVEHKADDLFGEWRFTRADKPICAITLKNVAATPETFAIEIKPPCDAAITRFAPAGWKLDRGQLVLNSRKGEVWRFEEDVPNTWRRVPQARNPIALVKQ